VRGTDAKTNAADGAQAVTDAWYIAWLRSLRMQGRINAAQDQRLTDYCRAHGTTPQQLRVWGE
jgi:hypothetical protein